MQLDIILKDHYMTDGFKESQLEHTQVRIIQRKENNYYTVEIPDNWDLLQTVDKEELVTAIELLDGDKRILKTYRHPFAPNLIRTIVD